MKRNFGCPFWTAYRDYQFEYCIVSQTKTTSNCRIETSGLDRISHDPH